MPSYDTAMAPGMQHPKTYVHVHVGRLRGAAAVTFARVPAPGSGPSFRSFAFFRLSLPLPISVRLPRRRRCLGRTKRQQTRDLLRNYKTFYAEG